MESKRAMTEFIGSLAVVYFAVTGGAMATGLVLAIFMMAMGGTILPMFTLAKMASGRDEVEDGIYDFISQILGGITAYGLVWWQTSATGGMTWAGAGELGPVTAVASLFAGFLLMMVYDRKGASWEVGILAWMMAAGGATISGAGDIGGMLVDSAWSSANLLAVFGGMILSGLGGYLAIMFGDKLLGEEE